ncbi:MAG: FlgD immunoglobulin-like domain containing protein [Candidatus Eisenbacteria bacterium]
MRPEPARGRDHDPRFQLAETSPVRVEVFDISGRLVRTLYRGVLGAGEHGVEWDGRTAQGDRLQTGVFLYRVHVGSKAWSAKIVLDR